MLDREIVFIAEHVQDHSNATLASRDLEMLADKYFQSVWGAINEISKNVQYYSSPKAFLNHISAHKDSVVLSLWSGESSKNRRALIPSICEAYGITYVGADPYIQTICADKHLSKELCKPYEIMSARDVIITADYEIPMLTTLQFPLVIKPNFEGGSIGIFADNLVDNYDAAVKVCIRMLSHFPEIIAEEYVAGEEISVCIAGALNHVDVFQAVRTSVDGRTFFEHQILGAEIKKMGKGIRRRDIVDFPEKEKEKMTDFFKKVGKVDMIRIDGRISKGNFTMIELTPDCSLSATGSMSQAFRACGYQYSQMFELLCKNAIKYQVEKSQNANM